MFPRLHEIEDDVHDHVLLPGALLLSAFAPWAVTPLLMLGGAYLCFEATEKIIEVIVQDIVDRRQQAGRRSTFAPKSPADAWSAACVPAALSADTTTRSMLLSSHLVLARTGGSGTAAIAA